MIALLFAIMHSEIIEYRIDNEAKDGDTYRYVVLPPQLGGRYTGGGNVVVAPFFLFNDPTAASQSRASGGSIFTLPSRMTGAETNGREDEPSILPILHASPLFSPRLFSRLHAIATRILRETGGLYLTSSYTGGIAEGSAVR